MIFMIASLLLVGDLPSYANDEPINLHLLGHHNNHFSLKHERYLAVVWVIFDGSGGVVLVAKASVGFRSYLIG